MNIHEKYINRCIELAKNGLGTTYPNPMVGSLLVHQHRIIGEGWHKQAGGPHAEVAAIQSVRKPDLLREATIYVSLEPCSHYGKTPPCSDLIIASGIQKVVIGTVDPFAAVSGRGITKLMDAGCEVIVGVLEPQCRQLNRRFFTFHQQQRPYIILKWAQSRDGFLAPEEKNVRAPIWITNQYARQLTHKWRSQEQAILVGTQTAVDDDPRLDTRLWDGSSPVRVVLDNHLRIPKGSRIFDGSRKTIVLTGTAEIPGGEQPNLVYERIDFTRDLPPQLCQVLYRHELQSLIVEGGRQTLQHFIDTGYWDEARIFTGELCLKKGIPAPTFSGTLERETSLEKDNLKLYTHD